MLLTYLELWARKNNSTQPLSSSLQCVVFLESIFLKVGNQEPDSEHQPESQELDLSHLAGESRKMGENRRILISKEKEAGSRELCIRNLAKQTVVSGWDPVTMKFRKVKTHTTKSKN